MKKSRKWMIVIIVVLVGGGLIWAGLKARGKNSKAATSVRLEHPKLDILTVKVA